jgi:ribosomal protein S18 acetylase RimI-like enzyme
MMAAFQVRPASPADLPHLMGLDHSSSTDRVWQLELHREPRGPAITTTFREVRLPRPVSLVYPNDPFSLADEWVRKAVVLVAADEKDPIGYLAIIEPRPSTAWITDMVVAPRWRRHGAASSLLVSAHDWAADRGNRRIFLETQSKNQAAIALAQKNGYEFCGYNENYYSTKDIALFFARSL